MESKNYTPSIGDRVIARRKVKSKIYHNMIVGPVVDTFTNCCRVATNVGTDIESSWQINYSDWNVEFIYDDDGNWYVK